MGAIDSESRGSPSETKLYDSMKSNIQQLAEPSLYDCQAFLGVQIKISVIRDSKPTLLQLAASTATAGKRVLKCTGSHMLSPDF